MSETTLGDLVHASGGSIQTGPFGTKLAAREYSSTGTPVISVGEIGNGELVLSEKTRRVDEDVTKRLPEYVLRSGDIVFARKGAVDRSAWVQPHEDGYFLGSDGIRVRFGEGIDSRFMAYQLSASEKRRWLLQHAVGTTLASLNEPTLRSLPVQVPPLGQQRAICAVLSALDDRRAWNIHMANLLTRFVRVVVTRALEFGSESVPVSRLARFVNGGAYTRGATGTGRMIIRIAELNGGPGNSTVYNDISVPEDNLARRGDILMSWSGSLNVYRWSRDEAIVNQHIFKVIPSDLPAWLVFDRLDSVMPAFRRIARDKATTMGHIQRGHLDSTEVLLPEADALLRMDREVGPLWDRLLAADRETHTVSSLRDALLPRLMSGRLQVADTDIVA